MATHQKLEEVQVDLKEDQALIVQDKKPCNIWKYTSFLLIVVVILLILAVCGVFSSSSSSSDDTEFTQDQFNGAVDDTDLTTEDSEATSDDTYLTGDVAPNIIFLLADDIGWADISHHDGEFSTPTIDMIIEGGVELTQFYSHALCTPSRMAFLTGRLAWKLGSQYSEVIHGMMTGHIPYEEVTYAEVTKDMGYTNYYVGRWGVGYAAWDMTPLGRGWDKFMGYFGPEGGYYNHTTDHFDDWMGVYDMWDMKDPFIEANMTYSEDLFLDRTLEYLEEAKNSDAPFTLTYAAQTAHAPIDDDWPTFYPPTSWSECVQDDESLIGREYYCNKVKYLDQNWGIIIDYLKTNNMWDNTILFMTSDNGALPYSDQDLWSDWGCNWPLRSGKVTHWEGGIKTWAAMSGGLIPEDVRGTTLDSLTHITDFATTAMRLSMTESEFEARGTLTGSTKTVDGKNLFDFENHDLIIHSVLPHYVPSWLHDGAMDYSATDGEWKYYVGFDESSAQGTGWYNFPGLDSVTEASDPDTFYQAGGYCPDGCLYDLTTDPYEYDDISSDYPEIMAYYSDLFNAIYQGGFDEDYHSGQPYEEDYRGYQEDNILRPYLNDDAVDDYETRRMSSTSSSYDYTDYTLSWNGDYDGISSPFD